MDLRSYCQPVIDVIIFYPVAAPFGSLTRCAAIYKAPEKQQRRLVKVDNFASSHFEQGKLAKLRDICLHPTTSWDHYKKKIKGKQAVLLLMNL